MPKYEDERRKKVQKELHNALSDFEDIVKWKSVTHWRRAMPKLFIIALLTANLALTAVVGYALKVNFETLGTRLDMVTIGLIHSAEAGKAHNEECHSKRNFKSM